MVLGEAGLSSYPLVGAEVVEEGGRRYITASFWWRMYAKFTCTPNIFSAFLWKE